MHEMFPANFLKKEDVPQPTRAVVAGVTMEEVTGDAGKEMKATLHFEGDQLKPMILNKGNAVTIAETFGDDTDAWVGKTIEVFTDPGVMFGGKRVGGLRVRVPAQQQRPAAPPGTVTGQALWDYSDGAVAKGRQTTAQVLTFLESLVEHGMDPAKVRVRPSGTAEQPVTADVWLTRHAPAPAGGPGETDEFIPF
jgi:hypothetical protein